MPQLFEWVERPEPAYGNFGAVHMCYVSEMHVGSVRHSKQELLSKSHVVAVMHKKTEGTVLCDDGVAQGKAWVEKEFLDWFLAVNRLAWAFMKDDNNGRETKDQIPKSS